MLQSQSIQELIEQLASEAPNIHGPAANKLVQIGAPAAVPLSRLRSPYGLERRARSVLKRMGGAAVPPLIEALQTGDNEVQINEVQIDVIQTFRLFEDKRTIDPVIDMLSSPNAYVREAAVRSLWGFRDEKVVEPLIHCLTDEDVGVCRAAAFALGSLQDRRAIEPLLEMLESPNRWLRQRAAETLGRIAIANERAADALRKHTHEKNKCVRKAAQSALQHCEPHINFNQ